MKKENSSSRAKRIIEDMNERYPELSISEGEVEIHFYQN